MTKAPTKAKKAPAKVEETAPPPVLPHAAERAAAMSAALTAAGLDVLGPGGPDVFQVRHPATRRRAAHWFGGIALDDKDGFTRNAREVAAALGTRP